MTSTKKRKIQPGFLAFARKHGTTMGTIVGLHVKNATSNFPWNVRTYYTDSDYWYIELDNTKYHCKEYSLESFQCQKPYCICNTCKNEII